MVQKFLVKEIKFMYAVIDIESTGGKYNEESITEIAIYKFDGKKVIDQFSSLVNPERDIQPFVQKLTGINEKMVKTAPKFFEIAKRIIEITNNCILVAHNADFDYRILKTEFKRLGFNFNSKIICTVMLSKKLIPNLKSYKLGNLSKSLGIPVHNRHRAQGDAMATLKVFELLLNKDLKKNIDSFIIENNKPKKNKFLSIINKLPNDIGVYYIFNVKNEIIYIGKSIDIKKRVTQHLSGYSKKEIKIQKNIKQIKYDLTGNELIALLKEENEIQNKKPKYNRYLIHELLKFGIRVSKNEKYKELIFEKINKRKKYLEFFKDKKSAIERLDYWINKYGLCFKYTFSKNNSRTMCFNYKVKKCSGACVEEEKPSLYNSRIKSLTEFYEYDYKNFLIIDEGYNSQTKSFVFIKNNKFKGYGYFELNYQIKDFKLIEKRMIKMVETVNLKKIINSYVRKNKFKKIIKL